MKKMGVLFSAIAISGLLGCGAAMKASAPIPSDKGGGYEREAKEEKAKKTAVGAAEEKSYKPAAVTLAQPAPAEPKSTTEGEVEYSRSTVLDYTPEGVPPPAYPRNGKSYDFEGDSVSGELSVGAKKDGYSAAGRPSAPPPPAPPAKAYAAPPTSAGVKAGASDDNKQFNYYLGYLDRFKDLDAFKLDVSNRIVVRLADEQGKSLPNCSLEFKDAGGGTLAERRTYADGRAMFFPSEDARFSKQGLKLKAVCSQKTVEQALDPNGTKTVDIKFPLKRQSYTNVPLDIAFLFDTTGSMGDEIARLKQTIEVIHFQITQISPSPDVRFGMVLYRDKGDEYVTKVIPLTSEMDKFKADLEKVEAGGGGDEPEDIQSGLADTMGKLAWRDEGIRLVFLIGDAPPHLDYEQQYTYLDAMRGAAGRAIKITGIGASGLPNEGEYVFRQLAQYTMGIFVFLTYGETGEAEGGGGTVSVSHHTGSNWTAENLEAIVVKMVKGELSYLTDQPVAEGEDYFETVASKDSSRDAVLEDLFKQAAKQLFDYSIVRIEDKTPTVIMPVSIKDKDLKAASEFLEDRLTLAMFKQPQFRILERKNIQQLLEEMKLQLSDLFDEKRTVEVGKMAGAKLALVSKLSRGKEKIELFIKLVRVDTAEVLSVALLKVDEWLVK